jgi:hypothetical protein
MGVSICGYFICGLKTFSAHAPLKFFFCLPPPPLATTWVKLGSKVCWRVCVCGRGLCTMAATHVSSEVVLAL